MNESPFNMALCVFPMGKLIECCSVRIPLSNKTSVISIACHETRGLFCLSEVLDVFWRKGP